MKQIQSLFLQNNSLIHQALPQPAMIKLQFAGTHSEDSQDHFEKKKKNPPPKLKERPWPIKKRWAS